MAAKSGRFSATALGERGQHLLKVLVQTYIGDGRPVGSQTLLRAAAVDLSPATIRGVMADLEDRGLIYSPHASAGRIPTVKGYRLFIDTMLRVRPLHDAVIDQLKERLCRDLTPHSLIEAASDMLSGITRLAGVVTCRASSTSRCGRSNFWVSRSIACWRFW